jgi:hypothetical protein
MACGGFTVAIVIAAGFFIYVALSTKSSHVVLAGFDKAKYELNKYHAERYWAIFVAGMLIWLYILGYPWEPLSLSPMHFNTQERCI